MRPDLTRQTTLKDFKDFYWLKEELQLFCREYGLPVSGSKTEISKRIEAFLLTGDIVQPSGNAKSRKKSINVQPLSLDTQITENHRCSQEVRAFFKTVISPKFHFSTYIQNYIKSNVGKTYRDVVSAWFEEEERKKNPAYKKKIAPQFEYNQFIQDYFADPNNKGNSREDAIKSWKEMKSIPGSNKYIPTTNG